MIISEKSIFSEAFGFTFLISLSLTLFPLQRACYLSINPQKDDTLETEKAQYYLPDGSTIEVCRDHSEDSSCEAQGFQSSLLPSDGKFNALLSGRG